VKNNLQIITSLLHLQRGRARDPRVRDAFQDSENRVRAIALVHETVHQARDAASVDLRGYIESIGRAVVRTNAVAGSIALDVEVPELHAGLDAAIPCGLILNEVLTNAFKHAFVGRAAGRVTVALRIVGDQVLLEIADDGVGLPEEIDLSNATTLGLQLVAGFVRQLEGTIEVDRSAGTRFRIRFPSARLGLP
jgi:two-component sensor histidine kinase